MDQKTYDDAQAAAAKKLEDAKAEWSKTRKWRHDRWVEITANKAASVCCVMAGVALTGLVRLTVWVLV